MFTKLGTSGGWYLEAETEHDARWFSKNNFDFQAACWELAEHRDISKIKTAFDITYIHRLVLAPCSSWIFEIINEEFQERSDVYE